MCVESNFTPEVYWHYIGSQYFPADIIKAFKGPKTAIEDIKGKINATVTDRINPCDPVELDYFANACAINQAPFKEETEVDKKTVTTDAIIGMLEENLHSCRNETTSVEQSLASRLASVYQTATDLDCLGLRSRDMDKCGEEVWQSYTKKSLEDFEKQMDVDDNVLRDSVYPDPIEAVYFECMEKKTANQVSDPAASLEETKKAKNMPKRGNHSRKPMAAKNSDNPAQKTGGSKAPAKFTVSRKRAHRESGQHRINSYIQDYRSHIKQVDDTVCQICNDGDYEERNLIVFCAVHFRCI